MLESPATMQTGADASRAHRAKTASAVRHWFLNMVGF